MALTLGKVFEMKESGPNGTLLERIKDAFPGTIIERKTSNLIRRVNNLLKKGASLDDPLPDLRPDALRTDNKTLSITSQDLEDDKFFMNIQDSDKNNKLVYDLEIYRRKNQLPTDMCKEWTEKIWGELDKSTSALYVAVLWTRLHDKVRDMKKSHKPYATYLQEGFHLPKPLRKSVTLACNVPDHSAMQVEQAMIKVKDLQTKNKEKDTKVLEMQTREVKCQRDLRMSQKEIIDQKKQVSVLKEKYQALKKELQPRNMRRRIETKVKKVQTLKEENKNLKKEVANKQLESERLIEEHAGRLQEMSTCIEKQQEEISKQKGKKITAQKKVATYKKECQLLKTSDKTGELLEKIDILQIENEEIKQKMEEYLQSDNITVWKDGKYTDDVRETYMALMANGVSTTKCHTIIETVLSKLAQKTVERLPQKSIATQMKAEAAALAKIQCGVTILNHDDNTLHIDGTKKKFKEYNTVNVTTGNGESLSLGFDEMSGGSAQDYLSSTVGIIKEIADLLLPSDSNQIVKDKKLADLLSAIRNTMSDRHIVNKSFNESFQQVRENYLSLIKENMEELSKEELDKLVHMNNMFCSVHVVGNCGSVAKSSLCDFEELCEMEKPSKFGESRTYQFLYALSKAMTFGHNYQKAGVSHYWAAYLEEIGVQNQIISLKGERINVLFLLGGAAYYHKEHLIHFLKEKVPQSNQLLTALHEIENPVVQHACRALGIVGQLITDPLFRRISDAKSVLELNDLWDDLLGDLEQFSVDPSHLMKGQAPTYFKEQVKTTSPKHSILFDGEAGDDQLTKMCVQMLSISMAILIKRQLTDQLPGGKFCKPSAATLDETSHCPATNLITERDFAHLDRQLQNKPNLSTIAVTGTVMYLNNKTGKWLNSLDCEKRSLFMETARQRAPDMMTIYRQRKKDIKAALSAKMQNKQNVKEMKEKKREETAGKLITKVSNYGGLWENENKMNSELEKAEIQYEAVVDQLKLRKAISVPGCNSKLFQLTTKGKKHDIETLKNQLVQLMKSATEADTETIETTHIDKEHVQEQITEKVAIKRKELSDAREKTPKRIKKKNESIVGASIYHKWKLDNGEIKWYPGKIIRALDDEKLDDCRYELKYDDDDELYEVELKEDIADHSVVIRHT